MTVELWNKIHELEQENKQLKNDKRVMDNSVKKQDVIHKQQIDEDARIKSELRQKLDKLQSWCKEPDINKEIVEKIREYWYNNERLHTCEIGFANKPEKNCKVCSNDFQKRFKELLATKEKE